ncbi:MAG: hypothetical protein ACRD0C_15000 [Acidimicrobiia bacterium]
MATTAQRTRRNGGSEGRTEWSSALARETTRDAQEALGRSLQATLDTMTTFAEIGQRVWRELVQLSFTGTREALRLAAEVQGSSLDAIGQSLSGWSTPQPAMEGWERLLNGSARAFAQFAETVQDRAEQGTERLKEAVDVMAEQVKETSTQLSQLGDVVESQRANAAAGARGATKA